MLVMGPKPVRGWQRATVEEFGSKIALKLQEQMDPPTLRAGVIVN